MKQGWTQSCDARLNTYWCEIINRAEELGYVTHLPQYRPYLRKATSQSFGVCCTRYHGVDEAQAKFASLNLSSKRKPKLLSKRLRTKLLTQLSLVPNMIGNGG